MLCTSVADILSNSCFFPQDRQSCRGIPYFDYTPPGFERQKNPLKRPLLFRHVFPESWQTTAKNRVYCNTRLHKRNDA